MALSLAAAGAPARAAAEDAKVEASAQATIGKVQSDYSGKAFGRGVYRLNRALRACGKTDCTDATVAALLRGLAAFHLRQSDKKGASSLFARAIVLAPDADLDSAYESPEARALWEGAGGKKVAPAEASPAASAQAPLGRLTHTPPVEQAVATPVPVFIGDDVQGVVRVVLQYQSAVMSSWKELALEKEGGGWAATIPCADVPLGTLRYYAEGFDSTGQQIAVAADAEHPYEVPIKTTITAEAPHLPGRPPPAACGAEPSVVASELQPAPPSDTSPARAPQAAPWPRRHRYWLGVSGDLDLAVVPSGDDLCIRNSATGRPANANNLYCTTLDGGDFPLVAISNGTLGDIVPGQGQGGHSDGALRLGDVRFMIAFDYALTPSLLLGARLGLIANRYPGSDAVRDGRAFGTPIHAELRASWLFGREPLAGTRLAPFVFVAGGVSEFDVQTRSDTTVMRGTPPTQTSLVVPVDIWRTDGPGFVAAGAGLRLTIRGRFAVAAAARGNLAFGDNGLMPVFGPELSAQVGF